MDCPSCGQANAPDRLECQYCEALLADVFAESEDDQHDKTDKTEKTDPMSRIGLSKSIPTDFETAYSRRVTATQYTGDLPRLYRFGDRYQILEKLGEGGMGRVYKALDLELDRPVALKTIRAEKGNGPEILNRFKQELVLARKITHKNVVRIYDLGEADGMKFFTMELIEGRSLRDELEGKGRLPTKEAIAFLKQMLSGLAEAHSQGVVHRDLKPQNVMLDAADNIRIMDFGIARTADSATMTGTDEMLGTPDYISPEQVKGEHADSQSDLYSLGVILYEMLTGQVPFKGDTAISKIVSRLQVTPPAARTLCPDIPSYLERIVNKLMEPDPDLRYKSAEEVLQDIEREQVDRSVALRVRKAAARYRWWIAAACLLGSIGTGVWVYLNGAIRGASTPDATTIAIVPVSNLRPSEELDWLEEGIPQMLVTNIAQSRALRPILTDRIHGILKNLGREGNFRFDAETIRVISQMAGSDFTLFGSFAESGGELRLNLTLHETSTGVDVPISVEGSTSRVFDVVDELTERIKDELGAGRWERDPRGPTKSVQAFRAYSQGLEALRNGAFQDAIPLFQEAIAADEGFALAHARLAEAYFTRNELPAAKEAIAKALPLLQDPYLSVVERYQIQATAARIEEDPARAVEAYGKLAELYPNDPDIRLSYASAVETLGELGKAATEYRRVLELSPEFDAAILGLGRSLLLSGRPEEAIVLLRDALEAGRLEGDRETKGMAYSILGVALRDQGRYDEAIKVLQMSLEERKHAGDPRGVMVTLTNLARAHEKLGRFDESEKLLAEALERARASRNETMESFALLNLGNVHAENGKLDEALQRYLDSLAIEQDRKEHLELGHRLDAIATIHLRRGQLAEAAVFLDQAEIELLSSGDQRELGYNELVAGQVSRARGQYRDAIEILLRGLSRLQGAGSKETIAETQRALAGIYADQGRFDECFRAVSLSVSGYRELGMTRKSGEALLELARVTLELGALAESETILESKEVRALEETPSRSAFYLALGELKRRRGALAEATHYFQAVIAAAETNGEMPFAIRGQIGLGAAQREEGRERESVDTLEAAYRSAERMRFRELQVRAELALAETQNAGGDAESALATAEAARTIAESFGARPLLLKSRLLLADVASALGRDDDAENHRSAVGQLKFGLLGSLEERKANGSEESVLALPEIAVARRGLERVLHTDAP